MGRQLRRVALDFEWPLHKVWSGFRNPHVYAHPCPDCEGQGWSPEARHMHDQWYGYVPLDPEMRADPAWTKDHPILRKQAERKCTHEAWFYGSGEANIQREAQRLADLASSYWRCNLTQVDLDALVEGNALPWEFTRRPRTEEQSRPENMQPNGWTKGNNGYIPTIKELNDHMWGMFGSGGQDYCIMKARARRKGWPMECASCNGSGEVIDSDEIKALHDAWEPEEPPAGPGYQMWETVSEGSPISPVFTEPCALATFLATGYPKDGNYDEWLRMIEGPGWAFSAATVDGAFLSGVQAAGLAAPEDPIA